MRYQPLEGATNRWLRVRLRELAATTPRSGYRRLWLYVRREGRQVNHKRV